MSCLFLSLSRCPKGNAIQARFAVFRTSKLGFLSRLILGWLDRIVVRRHGWSRRRDMGSVTHSLLPLPLHTVFLIFLVRLQRNCYTTVNKANEEKGPPPSCHVPLYSTLGNDIVRLVSGNPVLVTAITNRMLSEDARLPCGARFL